MTPTTHERRPETVTGAARGIGAAVARRLAGDGLAVGVVDLDEADCADAVEAIRGMGGSALPVAADVADEVAVTGAVARNTVESFLVNPEAGFVSGQVVNVAGGPVD